MRALRLDAKRNEQTTTIAHHNIEGWSNKLLRGIVNWTSLVVGKNEDDWRGICSAVGKQVLPLW